MENCNRTLGLAVITKLRDDLQLVFTIIVKPYTFLKCLVAAEGTNPVLQMPVVSSTMTEVAMAEWQCPTLGCSYYSPDTRETLTVLWCNYILYL